MNRVLYSLTNMLTFIIFVLSYISLWIILSYMLSELELFIFDSSQIKTICKLSNFLHEANVGLSLFSSPFYFCMKLATFGELILSCQTAFKNRWPTLCHVHVPLFLILILDQPFSTFNQNTWHSVSATSCLMSKTGSFGHVLQRIMWGIFRGSLFLRLWRTKIHDIQSLPVFKVQICSCLVLRHPPVLVWCRKPAALVTWHILSNPKRCRLF